MCRSQGCGSVGKAIPGQVRRPEFESPEPKQSQPQRSMSSKQVLLRHYKNVKTRGPSMEASGSASLL